MQYERFVVNPLQGGAGADEGIDEFVPGCEPVFSCNDKLGIAQGEVGTEDVMHRSTGQACHVRQVLQWQYPA